MPHDDTRDIHIESGGTNGLDRVPSYNSSYPPSVHEDNSTFALSAPSMVNHHPMRTRAKSGIVKPNPKYALLTAVSYPSIPKTVK